MSGRNIKVRKNFFLPSIPQKTNKNISLISALLASKKGQNPSEIGQKLGKLFSWILNKK